LCTFAVALRKESVDRNELIEVLAAHPAGVALRKESVDRNNVMVFFVVSTTRSLSARRAWIEMGKSETQSDPEKCRSPQGERG